MTYHNVTELTKTLPRIPALTEKRSVTGNRVNNRALLPTHSVDAIRGLAAFYVMIGHARAFLLTYTLFNSHPFGPIEYNIMVLFSFGPAAVMVFFLLSGYAIHYKQSSKLSHNDSSISWRDYAIRRIRRIYPPLLIALVVTFICDTIGYQFHPQLYQELGTVPLKISNLLGTLSFLDTSFTSIFGTDLVLWSLAFEAFFYVTYPLALLLNRRIGPLTTWFVFGIAALIAWYLQYHVVKQIWLAGLLHFVIFWPIWIGGMVIADIRFNRVRMPRFLWPVIIGTGLIILGATINYLFNVPPPGASSLIDLVWAIGFFGPVCWFVAKPMHERVRAFVMFFASKLSWLGRMSYSLYVVHFPIIILVNAIYLANRPSLPKTPWLMLVAMGLAMFVAYLCYLIAERPFTSQGKRNSFSVKSGLADGSHSQ